MEKETMWAGGFRLSGHRLVWIFAFVLLFGGTVASASERFPDTPIYPPIPPGLRADPPATVVSPHVIKFLEWVPSDTAIDLDLPTHLLMANGLEILSEVTHDRLSYRTQGSFEEWSTSPISVNGPHAVTFDSIHNRYFCADTENHRVIMFDDLEDPSVTSAGEINGVSLQRPHDVLFDPQNELTYLVNPDLPELLRFSEFGVGEGSLNLSALAQGYSRGISLVDDTLYLAASASGFILEINDFETGDVTVHPTYGKIAPAAAGSWETTGFVPNDIEFYDGYWYLSNFFHPWYASGTDPNLYKLVRFQSWEDLETGHWEDLSQFLPDGQVPYFFSLSGESLYLAAFDAVVAADAVYQITTGLFFDDFESAGLSGWTTVIGEAGGQFRGPSRN